MGNIRIGWGHRDITPRLPAALAGWAVDRFAEEMRDPLTVTALALESDSGECAIMVSCDTLYVEKQLQDKVRARVAGHIPGLDAGKLFLFATHTHNAPFISAEQLQTIWGVARNYRRDDQRDYQHPAEYHNLLVERISESVIDAWHNRAHGGISCGYDRAAIGHNRRVVFDDGSVQMYGETFNKNFVTFEGPADHDVELMYMWDQHRRLTGIAVNIACPSQTLESTAYVSSDFWHEVRLQLRRKFGEQVHLLPMLAPSGDVIPHEIIRNAKNAAGRIGKEIGLHYRPRDFDAELHRTASHIVFAMEFAMAEAARQIRTDIELKHLVRDIQLPRRRVSKSEAEEAISRYEAWKNEMGGDPLDRYDELSRQQRFALADLLVTLKHYEKQRYALPFTMELHVVRIGDIAITTNPFELYTDFGLQIKAASDARQTFNIQLACDQAGYVPTDKAVAGGSYGALLFNGEIGPEGGRLLVDYTVACIHQLWAE